MRQAKCQPAAVVDPRHYCLGRAPGHGARGCPEAAPLAMQLLPQVSFKTQEHPGILRAVGERPAWGSSAAATPRCCVNISDSNRGGAAAVVARHAPP